MSRYDIFGGLPDTIEDDWIERVEKLEDMMDEYIHLRKQARDVFEMRYQEAIDYATSSLASALNSSSVSARCLLTAACFTRFNISGKFCSGTGSAISLTL